MIGASRESIAGLREELDGLRSDPGFADLSGELLAVADLLGREKALRLTLSDSGQPERVRTELVSSLLSGRVSALTLDVVQRIVRARWSTDADLVDAVEQLGAQAAFTTAEVSGTLDRVEEEIFRFGRAVDASPDLQMLLTDPAQPAATKSAVIRDLLGQRTAPATGQLLEYLAGHLHGRRVDTAVAMLSDLAAQQQQRVVAEVTCAVPLDADQQRRLADALSRLKGRQVRLHVIVDPDVVGGVSVRIGDEVIDGTVASRLEQARRALLG